VGYRLESAWRQVRCEDGWTECGFGVPHNIVTRYGPVVRLSRVAPALAVCAAAGVFVGAAAAASVHVTVHAANHAPKVNKPWPVTVTVTNSAGKPIAATLTMRILFGGQQVGTIDNGRVYHFVGTWKEKAGNDITFPAASKGEPLTVQFVVKAAGQTVRKNWSIKVQ
jgi:hypothetical protein